MSSKTKVVVGRRTLEVSNLDKVMYPATGFTKGAVIDYYRAISKALLPHLKGRPLTLKRYPNGVDGQFFYEKECPSHRPEWVKTVSIWTETRNRDVNYCLIEDLPTLVWAANLADLEMHTSLARIPHLDRPSVVAFDLDPGPPAGLVDCCRVALLLKELFAELDLVAYPKTSGSKGMQVYLPINREATFDQSAEFARTVAGAMEQQHPKLVIDEMKKSLRKGKVFIDWSQNRPSKTTVSVYSLRARERPTVSTPLTWEEVNEVEESGDPTLVEFGPDDVLARVEKSGDLFSEVLKKKQKIPDRIATG